MTKKSKMTLALASMLGITAGAAAVSGFAWFTTTKSANINVTNIGIYTSSSGLDVKWKAGQTAKACTGENVTGGVNVTGASAASTVTDHFTGDNSTKTFTLKKYPNAKPTVKVGNDTIAAGNVTWTDAEGAGKTVTLATAPATDADVQITYTPYEALTDVSSVDGQHIYKPVWTASGEGQYATALTDISDATAGFVQFELTLTSTGDSPLYVYANATASINPAKTGDTADEAAASIARVAVIDETGATKFIMQEDASSPNNVGISSTYAGTKNYRLDGGEGDKDAWDLIGTLPTVSGLVTASSIPDKSSHDATWAAQVGNQTAANGYITTVPANSSKDIKITIWLEGTNQIGAHGAYTSTEVEKGMIGVTLPLIAF